MFIFLENLMMETKEKFSHLKGGEAILIENIRFLKRETEDGQNFSRKLASQIFILMMHF